jgi:hypothetical protein
MIHQFTSFNEKAPITFDDVAHSYTYKGRRLNSATGIIKNYEEEFDSDGISRMSATKWGEDQDEILAMWDSNGKVAAGFGTAIHAVLEHYFKHKALGARIQAVSGKEYNAAMPNHPFLRELILSLEPIYLDGDSHQEVCISWVKQGICGLVDNLLVTGDKTCRIRDYKITADILVNKSALLAPFAYLGSNKLAKNFLQLSVYSYMMVQSGWKVEGIDIFNWNGEWAKYSLEGKELMKTIINIGTCLKV